MITEFDAGAAVANRSILAKGDGEDAVMGQAVNIAYDGQTTLVRLMAAGVDEWFDTLDLNPTAGLAKCGRCSKIVPADTIDATGPYLTCPPCTEIIRS